jgi:hypothetical protein
MVKWDCDLCLARAAVASTRHLLGIALGANRIEVLMA